MYSIKMRHVHATILAVKKQKALHIMSVFAVSDIQHAMCIHHIVICGLFSSQYFSRLSQQHN